MTDPNQPKTFKAKKNGKYYKHFKSHQANQRQVDWDVFCEGYERIYGKKPNTEMKRIFERGYNMGYKEGKLRATSD